MEKKSALRGFLSYFYGNFIVLLLGFIQTPIATRIMTADEYGRTGMFETAVSCIYIFAILGMDQSFIRYYYKKGIDRRRLFRQCLFPSLLIVCGLIMGYLFFSREANYYLFERHGLDISILVIAYTVISVFERFLFLDVRMEQNGKLYSNINISQKILNILFLLLAFWFLGNDFRVVLYAMTLSWGATTLFLLIRYIFKSKGRRNKEGSSKALSTEELNSEHAGESGYSQKELMRYGLPFILILLMEWLLSSCDRVALKMWTDYEELGIYAAAMKIMVLLLTFKNTFLAYWSPVAMERYENDVETSCKAFFRRAYDFVRFFCVLMAFAMIIFRRVIVLLLGKDYRGADRVIPYLTLMPVFAMVFEITVQGIKFQKKNLYLNLASFLAIICNIIGNYFLVPAFYGVGAAMATGISYLIYFAVGSFFSERFYRVKYDYLRTFIEALLLLFSAGIAAFIMDGFLSNGIILLCILGFLILEWPTLKDSCKLIKGGFRSLLSKGKRKGAEG